TVPAINSGPFTINYESIDAAPIKGIDYYRLRMIDSNGNFSYSAVAAVRVTDAKSPQMFPNPAAGVVHVASGTDPVTMVTIYDVTGKKVARVSNAQSTIDIPVAALS